MLSLSSTGRMVVGIVQAIVAGFSILGSTLIISQVTRNKKNIAHLQQQVLLGMSLFDIVFSAAFFFPTARQAQELERGERQLCSAQGFLLQFGHASVLYNGTLALYYLLVIKFQFTDRRLNKLRPWAQILPTLFGICTATAALFLELYNPGGWNCWINPYPYGCDQEVGEMKCVRGENATVYRVAFFYVPLWAVFAVVCASMSAVYISVRRQEGRATRWAAAGAEMKKSQLVFWQSVFYVGAFFATWIFQTAARTTELITGASPSWLTVLGGCFTPIQGALNCLVYFRPRYVRNKKESGDPGHVVAWDIFKSALGCCDCSGLACPSRSSNGDPKGGGVHCGQSQRTRQRVSIQYHDDAKDIETVVRDPRTPCTSGNPGANFDNEGFPEEEKTGT